MAMKRNKGLGLGLEALLGPRVEDAPAAGDGALPTSLPLERLRAGRYQPRTRMDEGSLAQLAESIRAQGVMQPVLVRPLDDGDYEIIAGERRCRAAKLAGLDRVPVTVHPVADEAAAVMALIENIQREDLHPLEEAQGLQRLVQEFHLTHEEAARAVGRSRSTATNLMRLLQLAEPVQRLLAAGDLEMGHARALLGLDGATQVMCAQQVVARRLSVREAERLVARHARASSAGRGAVPATVQATPEVTTPGAAGGKDALARDIARLERRLADHLTAPVQIRWPAGRGGTRKGEVTIPFASLDALDALLEKLGLGAET